MVAIGFTALCEVYSNGRLLYAGDFVGVYNAGWFLANPTPNYLIPSVAAGLAPSSPVAAQAIFIFLDAFLCAYACQLFAREVCRNTFEGKTMVAYQTIATLFYFFSPFSITLGYSTITTDLFLNQIAFFLVLVGSIRLARAGLGSGRFRGRDAVLLGVALALSPPIAFQEYVRQVGLELVIVVVAAAVYIYGAHRSPSRTSSSDKPLTRLATLTIPISTGLLLVILFLNYPYLIFHLGDLNPIEAATAGQFSGNDGNGFWFVIRLLSRAQFSRFPYSSQYSQQTVVAVASYLWPTFALLLAPVIAVLMRVRDWRWIVVAALANVPCIVWSVGLNPPFAAVNQPIIDNIPAGNTLLPYYFLVWIVMTKLYAILAAFVIIEVALIVGKAPIGRDRSRPVGPAGSSSSPPAASLAVAGAEERHRRRRPRSVLAVVWVVATMALLLSVSYPVYDGSAFSLNPSIDQGGLAIPSQYYSVAGIVHGQASTTLVLPQMGPDITTSWGCRCGSVFYRSFYYPTQIIVPAYYGQNEIWVPAIKEQYANLTEPLSPGPTTSVFERAWSNYSEGVTQFGPKFDTRANASLNLSTDEWLTVSIPIGGINPSDVEGLIQAQQIWLGVQSGSGHNASLGWYVLGSGEGAPARMSSSGVLTASVVLAGAYQGSFNPSNITRISLWFRNGPLATQPALGAPNVAASNQSVVASGWLGLIRGKNVGFILVDSSLIAGLVDPLGYAVLAVEVLLLNHLISVAYNGSDLQLYRVVYP